MAEEASPSNVVVDLVCSSDSDEDELKERDRKMFPRHKLSRTSRPALLEEDSDMEDFQQPNRKKQKSLTCFFRTIDRQADECKRPGTRTSKPDETRGRAENRGANEVLIVEDSDDAGVQILEDSRLSRPGNAGEPTTKSQKDRKLAKNFIDDQDVEIITLDENEMSTHTLEYDGSIHTFMLKVLKPHQVEGVEFMWRNIGSIKDPNGCILAHSMGLGKSLQIVTLVHTFARRQLTRGGTAHCLLLVPSTLLQNWKQEFNKWLPKTELGIQNVLPRSILSSKLYPKFSDRLQIIGSWSTRQSGVLVMGYEMFTTITSSSDSLAKKAASLLYNVTDLVILDEGHRLKNDKSKISQAIRGLQTKRRIILTGTPIQNRLEEYWCMVDFVAPGFLGSKKRFNNLFANPIKFGMLADAEMSKVRMGKRRMHILVKKLSPIVQRRDESILRALLPPKQEIVIYTRLSEIQQSLYQELLQFHKSLCPQARGEDSDVAKCKHLLPAHAAIQRIVNHPDILYHALQFCQKPANTPKNCFTKDCQSTSSTYMNLSTLEETDTRANPETVDDQSKTIEDLDENYSAYQNTEEQEDEKFLRIGLFEWAQKYLGKEYNRGVLQLGGKMMVLMQILDEAVKQGHKTLVFSQYVTALNTVEEFIQRRNKEAKMKLGSDCPMVRHLRLDGSTQQSTRQDLVNKFNREDSKCNVFLITTQAGGFGLNLPSASRVVILDAAWNPANDAQASVRAFRLGQKQPVFVYRFISHGTMENSVYDRQVSKVQVSRQVVDDTNVARIYTSRDLDELFRLSIPETSPQEGPEISQSAEKAVISGKIVDNVLLNVLKGDGKLWISKIGRHDDAIEEDNTEELTTEEQKQAEEEDVRFEKAGAIVEHREQEPQGGHGGRGVTIPPPMNRMYMVTIPASFIPGVHSAIKVPVNGEHYMVQVPPGYYPGLRFSFDISFAQKITIDQ